MWPINITGASIPTGTLKLILVMTTERVFKSVKGEGII